MGHDDSGDGGRASMNAHAARVLELDPVRRLLVRWIASPLGTARLERLRPSQSRRVVTTRLARTREAMDLMRGGESPPLEAIADPAPMIRRAGADAVLSGEELHAVGAFVSEGVRLGEFLRRPACPELCALLKGISASAWEELERAETAVRTAIDENGAVRDEASPALRTIRASLHAIDSRVRDAAHLAMKDLAVREALQETVVHYRSGRAVLPVRASMKDKVKGVLRDVSGSGATLFVEPVEAAKLSRQKERLLKEQDREERRIRRGLTRRIAELAPALSLLRAVVARVEVVFAAAAFGLSRGGVCAELSTDGRLELCSIYHPLLPEDSVPLSLSLDAATRTLLITGPNTGGKTVAVKSVGLTVLMTACGLPVFGREGTVVPLVRDILADIGDEQSIEQSLSTFSGHMSNIVGVIRRVKEIGEGCCLVLLDELGAGTDPAEGEALGCAVLEWLHREGGPHLRILATSHFARLKELAASEDGMANARMEFDPTTLRPTFLLSMGAAGASQAFPVAQRLGLPSGVLARAREFLGPERVEFQKLVASMDAERHHLREARSRADELARNLEDERRIAREQALEARTQAVKAHDAFRRDAEEVLEWSRRELKKARAEEGVSIAQRRHVTLHEKLMSVAPDPAPAERQRLAAEPFLRPGDQVVIAGVGRGVLEAVNDETSLAAVLVAGKRVEVSLNQIEKASPRPQSAASYVTTPEETVGGEVLLVGLRADEARDRVVRYLDDARAADMATVRIVHGLGRGVLKEIVRDALRSHPGVAKFRTGSPQEGGHGVTVAYLQ
ncbi:Smr/MutS family protein [Candidatus Fermentibacteria bacterium]|nr:Smr/MutS family protein [Candidatus Fermentibacteria bacterium]